MRFSALLPILLLGACAQPEVEASEPAKGPFLTEAETEVYAPIFASMNGEPPEGRAFTVVLNSLTALEGVELRLGDPPPSGLPTLSGKTWLDFKHRNTEPVVIPALPAVPEVLGLIHQDTIRSIFSGGVGEGWRTFRTRYTAASGFAEVSRVGFSPDSTEALAFVSVSCGELCGSGQYVQLRRLEGMWNVVGTLLVWIS